MTERFAYNTGTITVPNGATSVTGVGTSWSGRDREGAQVWYFPPGSPAAEPKLVGIVAAVDPRGVYEDLVLPLLMPWTGESLEGASYVLLDGPAIANGATQAAVYGRFAAHLDQNMGLVGNTGDEVDFDLVPENSLFVDSLSRVIYQWRGGVLEEVYTIGISFTPRGEWDELQDYSQNDLVNYNGYVFVSSIDENSGNTPGGSPFPASDSNWTLIPLPGVSDVLAALGINSITVSTSPPTGGVDGDVWFQVN